MRISDWSSDVCSSDLRCPGGGGHRRIPGDLEPEPGGAGAGCGEAGDCRGVRCRLPASSGNSGNLHPLGRASCRKRVCQYVEISVVAVPLTKNSTVAVKTHPHTPHTYKRKKLLS